MKEPRKCSICGSDEWRVAMYFERDDPQFACLPCVVVGYEGLAGSALIQVRVDSERRAMFGTFEAFYEWLFSDPVTEAQYPEAASLYHADVEAGPWWNR